MDFYRFFFIVLSHILFLTNIKPLLCVNLSYSHKNLFSTPILRKGKFSFINKSYNPSIYLKYDQSCKINPWKYNSSNDYGTLSHSESNTLLHSVKSTPLSTLQNSRSLNLSQTSKLKSSVTRFVEKFKESESFKDISIKVEKFKDHFSNLSNFSQFVFLFVFKITHSYVLPKFNLVFPFQLLPLNSGHGTSIGLETLFTLPFFYYFVKDFNFPKGNFRMPETSKLKVSLIVSSLIGSFILSGLFNDFVNNLVLFVSALDFPVSIGMMKTMSIIVGHFFWITVGSLILKYTTFPLFGEKNPWYKFELGKNWVYDVLLTYFSSFVVYDLSEVITRLLNIGVGFREPEETTEQNIFDICGSNDWLAILLTSIGPCVTGPWWEELLYRVYTFKLLNTVLPSLASAFISSVIFSLNHMNIDSSLHLFSLGFLWSISQMKTGNIFVPFLTHLMWNLRIFLESITGV